MKRREAWREGERPQIIKKQHPLQCVSSEYKLNLMDRPGCMLICFWRTGCFPKTKLMRPVLGPLVGCLYCLSYPHCWYWKGVLQWSHSA